jgi:hypothetical protein
MCRGSLTLALLASVIAAAAPSSSAATLFDPALTFRVLRTNHFRIYFHQGEDRLAARLATIAEQTWGVLQRPLATRPPPLTHVVIADQTELANGYATPLPYNTIVIFPTAPPGAEFATDDWLRLVFTHEFTHIVHLDRSESWARVLRSVFGRTLPAFPNLFLPTWQIEGLATYEESAITGEGRLHAGDFRAIVDVAARQGALEPLDRVNGGLTDWPSGTAAYAYGLGFHQYLAERFGPESLGALTNATSGRLPYTTAPVFRKIFGESLGSLWRGYEASVAAAAGPESLDSGTVQLTRHGFISAAPRFDRESGQLVYTKRTPDAFPSLERFDPATGVASHLTTRYFGSTTAPGRDSLYFDQLEIRRNVALESDLYAWSRDTRRVRRLTTGARLRDPDVSPDGRTLVAVRERLGQRELVTLAVSRPDSPTSLVAEEDTQFNGPRWSPDGRSIVAERHRLGHDPEIVLVDVASRTLRPIASVDGVRIVMPTWRPDGAAIIAAAAPGDRPFNLYEFSTTTDDVRQLTHSSSGAIWPDVSPDGGTIVFAGYTIAGYDIFSIPYPGDPPVVHLAAASAGNPPAEAARGESRLPAAYSPWETLKPVAWEPIVESEGDQLRIGAATGGRDVLGYHVYATGATWLAAAPQDAIRPNGATPDWFASYAYDRWRPTVFAAASSETSFFAGPATAQGTPSAATRRQRQLEGGVLLPIVRARSSHAAWLSALRSIDDYSTVDGALRRERTSIRAAWRSTTAKSYGYAISLEDGVAAGGTAEFVRRALGASDDATIVTGDVRAYLPGLKRHHVLAARLAAGASTGDPIAGRTFVLGGASPDGSVIDFGSGAISLMRGFGGSTFAGTRVALVNADYRWPIARPQRGVGTWPLFLHTVHAAAFADAGHAWTRRFDAAAIKTAVGAELSFDLVAGYSFPFTATAGVAWGHDGSGTVRGGATSYFRIGRAF